MSLTPEQIEKNKEEMKRKQRYREKEAAQFPHDPGAENICISCE